MLKPGDKIRITETDGNGRETSYGWTVIEYDNGLLKVEQKGKRKTFNMRSTSFHSAEVE